MSGARARLAGAFRHGPGPAGDEYDGLRASRLRDPVPVEQPLVLISQVQRSGGTLLLRLLDGHPQCHVVPFQLRRIDEAAKWRFTDPGRVWQTLYDPKLEQRYRSGYRQVKRDVLRDEQVFSFLLPPDLQRAIYETCAGLHPDSSARALVDCYFTSYFNGWLDYGNLTTGPKRWVVGFEPAVAGTKGKGRALAELYPDGRTISIVRDPWSWYASARRWEPRWRDREGALGHWCRVAKRTLSWRKAAGSAFLALSFTDLLSRTEETVGRVAAWLGIDDVPELLVPTFNGQPIGANTSFADVSTTVSEKPLERARQELDDDEIRFVTERAGRLHERLLRVVEKDRAATPASG